MKQKILTMLQMQDAMNSKVNENWRDQGFAWYRAIWVEAAELLDHYGWKWWKKQEVDREQVILELVDIWHFGLSLLMASGAAHEDIVEKIEAELKIESDESDFRLVLESFVSQTLVHKQFHLAGFAGLMSLVELDFNQLYQGYVGKNVLNFFRQDYGYKSGEYVKVWGGKEDNEHLMEVVGDLDDSSENFREAIYRGLKNRYEAATA